MKSWEIYVKFILSLLNYKGQFTASHGLICTRPLSDPNLSDYCRQTEVTQMYLFYMLSVLEELHGFAKQNTLQIDNILTNHTHLI